KEAADIRTSDQLALPIPKAEYVDEVIEPSEIQKEMVKSFGKRAEAVRGGGIDPSADNMLKITNDGRKCALDQRLVNPMLPDEDDTKVNRCAQRVYEIWEETMPDRSTQLVFSDLSTPKSDGSFNVYDDLRDKLVAKGIPENEIAFIHDFNTEAKKSALFRKVRSGQVRVLMGSTQKMGAGTNVQDRLIALHHLDVPWRPSDLEQQEGRILRQGNRNPEVKIFRYITKGSFDQYMWQVLENKQKFISQIMTSKSPMRSCEDVDDATLNFAEIKALATGNPLIKEKMELDIQVSKLKLLKSNHISAKYRMENDIARKYPAAIVQLSERISGMKDDLATTEGFIETMNENFEMTVDGKSYTERKEAGAALLEAAKRDTAYGGGREVGEYHGFSIHIEYQLITNTYRLTLERRQKYTVEMGRDGGGNITRIHNAIAGIGQELAKAESRLKATEEEFAIAKTEVGKPFAQEAELKGKQERLAELNALLNMDSLTPAGGAQPITQTKPKRENVVVPYRPNPSKVTQRRTVAR
ncbi:MAG: DNA methylase, partial [Lachnospiraceae bacterium]|nr:DNA methylase [Lachnospiraceae bacterium]